MGYSERDQSIGPYLPLARRVAADECRKLRVEQALRDDIHSFAMEGLLVALGKFDQKKGTTFRYFAERQIRWTIYDNLRKMGPLPRGVHRRVKFLNSATELLEGEGLLPPPKSSTEAVHRLAGSMKNLVATFFVTMAAEQMDQVTSVSPDAETLVAKKECRSTLLTYIRTLPEKEQKVLVGHFFEERTLTDIAVEMSISLSWVSKIMTKALKNIRILLNENPDIASTLKDP